MTTFSKILLVSVSSSLCCLSSPSEELAARVSEIETGTSTDAHKVFAGRRFPSSPATGSCTSREKPQLSVVATVSSFLLILWFLVFESYTLLDASYEVQTVWSSVLGNDHSNDTSLCSTYVGWTICLLRLGLGLGLRPGLGLVAAPMER